MECLNEDAKKKKKDTFCTSKYAYKFNDDLRETIN